MAVVVCPGCGHRTEVAAGAESTVCGSCSRAFGLAPCAFCGGFHPALHTKTQVVCPLTGRRIRTPWAAAAERAQLVVGLMWVVVALATLLAAAAVWW